MPTCTLQGLIVPHCSLDLNEFLTDKRHGRRPAVPAVELAQSRRSACNHCCPHCTTAHANNNISYSMMTAKLRTNHKLLKLQISLYNSSYTIPKNEKVYIQ